MSWDFGGSNSGSGGGSDWDSGPAAPPTGSTGGSGGSGWDSAGSSGWDSPGTSSAAPAAPDGGSAGSGGSGSAPRLVLVGAGLLALLAIARFFVVDSTGAAMVAWFVGGPVAIGLVALHIGMDVKRRADPWYAESPLDDVLRRVVIALTLLAVVLNAYTVADHLARR